MNEDITYFKTLNRKKIKETLTLRKHYIKGTKYAIISGPSNNKYYLKLYKSNSENIQNEYEMQKIAANNDVAPKCIMLSLEENFFITECITNKLINIFESR